MNLWGIFRFEFGYQVRRGWPWLIFTALVVFAFLFVRENYVSDALYGDFFLNSPFLIAGATVFGGLIWLLVAAAIAGEAAARDVATGMHPLIYTVPVSKADYLGGRFLAAFVLNAFLLLAVQAGILLAIYSPGVDAEIVGPFRPAAYLTAYAFIALPNAFVATAIQFSLAARSGRAMASYLGSLLLFFMGFFVASFLLFKRGLGTLLDPIGIRFIVEDLAHVWTTIEKSARLIELEGTVLDEPSAVARHRSGDSRSHLRALSLRPSYRKHPIRLAALPPSCRALPPSPRLRWTSRREGAVLDCRRDCDRRENRRSSFPTFRASVRASPSTRVRRSPSRGRRSGRSRRAGPDSPCWQASRS